MANQFISNSFLHFIGTAGSHVIPLPPIDEYVIDKGHSSREREIELRQIHGVVECIATRHSTKDVVYYFDGQSFQKVSHETAATLMRNYVRQIRIKQQGGNHMHAEDETNESL